MIELEINKTYKTRGGDKVIIFADIAGLAKGNQYALVGLLLRDDESQDNDVFTWDRNGYFMDDEREHLYDLVEEWEDIEYISLSIPKPIIDPAEGQIVYFAEFNKFHFLQDEEPFRITKASFTNKEMMVFYKNMGMLFTSRKAAEEYVRAVKGAASGGN